MAEFLELEVRNTVAGKTALEAKPGFDDGEILQVGIEESNVDDSVTAIYGIGTGPEGTGVVGEHLARASASLGLRTRAGKPASTGVT